MAGDHGKTFQLRGFDEIAGPLEVREGERQTKNLRHDTDAKDADEQSHKVTERRLAASVMHDERSVAKFGNSARKEMFFLVGGL